MLIGQKKQTGKFSTLCFFIFIVITFFYCTSALAISTLIPGAQPNPDINQDGTVNGLDIKLILSTWLGNGTCGSLGQFICDIFQDGKENSLDAAQVIIDFNQPTPSPTFQPSPSPSGAPGPTISFAPYHFGERGTTDYNYPAPSGLTAGQIFNGAFIGIASTADANSLLPAAQGRKVIINLGGSDPCPYWNGDTWDIAGFATAVNNLIPAIAPYRDRIIGLLMLNEPDNPDGCPSQPVPARDLYDAAALIRPVLATNGFATDFPVV